MKICVMKICIRKHISVMKICISVMKICISVMKICIRKH